MTYTKKIVCLASSRKTSGRCIAGKEFLYDGPGSWFRPVSARPTHEVSEEERRYQDGRYPRLLDVLTVPCIEPRPVQHQSENHLLDPDYFWARERTLTWDQLDPYLDNPAGLWNPGYSSYAHLNNRVPDSYAGGTSLYLIGIDLLRVLVGPKSPEYPKRIVRGEFTYKEVPYRLAITDPGVEAKFLERPDGSYTIATPKLCVSLGDPYQGHFYKLIAAVLYEERFS